MTHSRSRLVAAATGAALTLAAGGVAVAVGSGAFAQTQTQTPTQNQTPTPSSSGSTAEPSPSGSAGQGERRGWRMHGPDGHQGGRMGGFGVAGGLGGPVLHGEVVVGDADGSGTTRLLVQQGEVTKVSGPSVTVRSTDGFTVTWTVDDTTRGGDVGDLAVGDQVHAAGTKTGDSTGTATVLAERRAPGSAGPDSNAPGGRGPVAPGRSGSATPSPTVTGSSLQG